jgi:hypothetical protein
MLEATGRYWGVPCGEMCVKKILKYLKKNCFNFFVLKMQNTSKILIFVRNVQQQKVYLKTLYVS